MVDALTSKTIAWEKEKGFEFTYDGVSSLFKISVDCRTKFWIFYFLIIISYRTSEFSSK